MIKMGVLYNSPILEIPNATESDSDAAQNMFHDGVKQYNLCGQFSVAYCMRARAGTKNIDDFMEHWELTDLPWWKTIFRNKLARTTGVYDLQKMLASFDPVVMKWSEVKVDPVVFSDTLVKYWLITGVKIDHTGYLVGSGIPHWVVVETIDVTDKNHAIVDIYNPYTNIIEPYSWRELMTSTGNYKQGLWVMR